MEKVCFVLGVMPRSGTNFLANVITLHPECVDSAPLHEDFLLSQSHWLQWFCRRTKRNWHPKWEKRNAKLADDVLLAHIGQGLTDFVCDLASEQGDKTVITKTPSSKQLRNFFRLFPERKLIIVIRDGRALVESGVRSFDWDFEKACFDWHRSTQRIQRFVECHQDKAEQILLVKYEDLLANTDIELARIYAFIGCDPSKVASQQVREMDVIGSSEKRGQQQDVDWKPVKRSASFDPAHRHSQWPSNKQRRFDWLAGKSLVEMGYQEEAKTFTLMERCYQRLADLTWGVRVLPRLIYHAVRYRKWIIKTS
uniref:sulfotransferase family protein n=1 Tax=Thaumasiovibrio occultus TaxID=1891184 RepID=UPI000B351DE5|nr:sulfotransferase [Thaumasiovibrio occultus]